MSDTTIWHDEGLDILDEDECLRLLGTMPIGRVGICSGSLPAILPVNFELYGRLIVFRTGRGTKLDAAVRSAVVAFQADQYDALYHTGWSVLAIGQAKDMTEQGSVGAGQRVDARGDDGLDRVGHLVEIATPGRVQQFLQEQRVAATAGDEVVDDAGRQCFALR